MTTYDQYLQGLVTRMDLIYDLASDSESNCNDYSHMVHYVCVVASKSTPYDQQAYFERYAKLGHVHYDLHP